MSKRQWKEGRRAVNRVILHNLRSYNKKILVRSVPVSPLLSPPPPRPSSPGPPASSIRTRADHPRWSLLRIKPPDPPWVWEKVVDYEVILLAVAAWLSYLCASCGFVLSSGPKELGNAERCA
ncbi:hypothetical protein MLD38_038372 [Melastoma candidum]|uniref:Uncharacterized protein n=1 Tax=Melastoma candidum TaxID=119954 RepID=A0ACB9KYY9_9MYRT|nr:hypothetical protein MLD38_038372 [Melastoma candidum]